MNNVHRVELWLVPNHRREAAAQLIANLLNKHLVVRGLSVRHFRLPLVVARPASLVLSRLVSPELAAEPSTTVSYQAKEDRAAVVRGRSF